MRIALLALALLSSGADAEAATRALVIGIDYSRQQNAKLRLANAAADARLVGQSLRRLNISTEEVANPEPDQIIATVKAFSERGGPDDVAVIYFSGHGFQVRNENFLLLGDGRTIVSLTEFVGALRARFGVVVLFVDACRSPLEAQWRSQLVALPIDGTRSPDEEVLRSLEELKLDQAREIEGLAALRVRGSGFKAYFATEPDNVAYDRASSNPSHGPFALAISESLRPDESIDAIFADITRRVARETLNRQTPWSQGSLEAMIPLAGRLEPRSENPDVPLSQIPTP